MNDVLSPFLGKITLVGAGPGDPELLTIKAARAIAAATVILTDDLVSPEVLAHANANARIIFVGKRGGCLSTPQSDIEQLMISEVKRGEIVVRLKGGDPLLFGRAGEEMTALSHAGIDCTVINGVTAALAAANSAHISLTHRDYAHGVLFVTGHAQTGGATTDWIRLGHTAAQNKLTLVIYMGVKQAKHIQTGLLVHLCATTPVALIQNASSKSERTVLTTLQNFFEALLHEQLASPLVMVIGDVAGAVSVAKDRYNPTLVD